MLYRKFTHILLGVVLFTYSSFSAADWFTSSKVNELIKKADAGDKDSQFAVGSAYDFGEGAPRDGEKAKKYYLMAAEQGHAEAENSLGSGYEAEGNSTEASSWFYRAAQHNHPLAMNSLAIYYIKGIGMPEDKNKGLELYTKSANLGWPGAMYNLGVEYLSGNIVEIDASKACSWVVRSNTYSRKLNIERIIAASTKAIDVLKNQFLSAEDFNKCREQEKDWVPPLMANLTHP